MERNKYELQREVLARKYETILKDFEDTNDDRRIAWNCYQQIIGACEAMRDSGMENNFVCCAVNKSIREQETEIDEIITRFTGKVYKGVRWMDKDEPTSPRERAIKLLQDGKVAHVIYGYRAKGETMEGSWETEMLRFYDDDSFVEHIDRMQAEIDGLEMVLAVHAR